MRVRSACVVVAAVAAAWLPSGAAGAAVEPSLAVGPTEVVPGATFTITVTCAVAPAISVVETDVARVFDGASGTTHAGTTTVDLPAGQFDTTVTARCGGQALGPVVVDVDNPMVGLSPPGSDLPPGAGPEGSLFGTDCPPGTQVTVRITNWDLGDPEDGDGGFVETLPIDERGDWVLPPVAVADYAIVPPPGTPEGTVLRELRFDASCGDVTYPRVTQVLQTATGEDPPPVPGPPTLSIESATISRVAVTEPTTIEGLADLYGTGCPPNAEASIRITPAGYATPAEGGPSRVETRPTDELGTWSLTGLLVTLEAVETLDPVAPGTIMRSLRLDASCGDVRYPTVTMVIQRSEGHGRLPRPPVPPPAGALPGSPDYTG